MKQFRNLVALVLVAVMSLALCSTALATGENLSITVNNAKIGATYTLYKLLDATVDGEGAIAYQGTVPTELDGVLERVTESGYTFIRRVAGQTDDAYFAALKTYADDNLTAVDPSPVRKQLHLLVTTLLPEMLPSPVIRWVMRLGLPQIPISTILTET